MYFLNRFLLFYKTIIIKFDVAFYKAESNCNAITNCKAILACKEKHAHHFFVMLKITELCL